MTVQSKLRRSNAFKYSYIGKLTLASAKPRAELFPSYVDLAEPMLSVLRRFITTPLPILAFYNNEASPVLTKAGDALATCIGRLNQDDLTLSTIYSLLNYLPAAKSENTASSLRSHLPLHDSARNHQSFANRTPEERHAISSNTLFVVTKLATHFKHQEIVKLALSMLLQRIRNSDVVSERSALICVAELAPYAGKDDFTEAVIALTEFARHVPRPDHEGQSGIVSIVAHSEPVRSLLDINRTLSDSERRPQAGCQSGGQAGVQHALPSRASCALR